METVMFYIIGAITLVSAFFVVFLRRPVHNVLFMIMTMIGLAGMFLLLRAEFIAMVQLIVYAGAIMVLFLFVIMLLNLDQDTLSKMGKGGGRWWIGALIAEIILVLMIFVIRTIGTVEPQSIAAKAEETNTGILARELFTTYLLPFEIASVLLLAAIIGTVLIVRRDSGEER